ncbi:hypothetical protein OWR29_05760 [Actinoplanes sp. Pm04-4]|uniref:Uncharacterized protein n=1 Tax=Paractinoplanes pyxinae TaxID=2997416 RepID=A0ABT4ATB7_9ACTN|nr:hypothetical protein [Actinoplanes pyxinae]MCY1137498.1 hypothetical protein [Actinoplanes pyxinae]
MPNRFDRPIWITGRRTQWNVSPLSGFIRISNSDLVPFLLPALRSWTAFDDKLPAGQHVDHAAEGHPSHRRPGDRSGAVRQRLLSQLTSTSRAAGERRVILIG